MSKYTCDDCDEEFDTLSAKRLHDCPSMEEVTESPQSTDPSTQNTDSTSSDEDDRPWEVKQGLEPEYDCPECDYYSTGISTGPHAFLDHLRDEHGYTSEEAHRVLNG